MKTLITTLLSALALCLSSCASKEEPGDWTEIFPGGDTLCAAGTPYSFHVKPGAADRLMIFFNGGGGCWSGDACDINTEPTPYTPLASIDHNDPKTRGGAFALDNPDNPFTDWSQVFVSYCTGDIHLGARDKVYTKSDGSKVTIRHRGKENAQSALDWVYENITAPERVFVSGGSAGAVASPYYASLLADHYKEATIIHFAGGGGGYRLPPQTELLQGWGVFQDLPAWPEFEKYSAETLRFDDLYAISSQRHPNIRYHQFNSAYDVAQEYFLRLLDNGDRLHPLLIANLADLKATVPHFASYTTRGDFHTILRFDELYEIETEGVPVLEWVHDIAAGKAVDDVTCGSAEDCDVGVKSDLDADFTNPGE